MLKLSLFILLTFSALGSTVPVFANRSLSESLLTESITSDLRTPFSIHALAWSPTGERLAVGTSDGLKIYDGRLQLIHEIKDFTDYVSAVAWSPDGTQLAAGAWYADGSIRIWDYDAANDSFGFNRTLSKEYKYYGVTALRWSPDGRKLAEVGQQSYLIQQGFVTVYDVLSLRLTSDSVKIGEQLDKVVWNSESNQIAVAGGTATSFVYIFNANTLKEELVIESGIRIKVLEWTQDNHLLVDLGGVITVVDPIIGADLNYITSVLDKQKKWRI